MSQVPVVPGLSRNRIEMKMVSLLQDIQPEALSGQCPTDVETIFEIYMPDQYGIVTGYEDLSVLGDDVLGHTNAKKSEHCRQFSFRFDRAVHDPAIPGDGGT